MGEAKKIVVKPIASKDANRLCKLWHYSKKVVPNSQLHFGVFYQNQCLGVMQFGPSMFKDKMMHLVEGTKWNGFLELNRMSFSDKLPRFSESRALSVALKMIRKNYPHIEWIVSFADATQCGDGAIYRATGFVLTQIKVNKGQRIDPATGEVKNVISERFHNLNKDFDNWEPVEGFMLRYMYFLNPEARERLTVDIIPFSEIEKQGVRMYRGNKLSS